MTQFAQQANRQPAPQGMPFPMPQPPNFAWFAPTVPPMLPMQGVGQTAFPPFPGMQAAQQPQGQPFVPFIPPVPQAPGAMPQQPGQAPLPTMPFPNPQQQSQTMPTFPFVVPLPVSAAPGAQPSSGPEGFQPPIAPIPQPHVVYEHALKTTIDFLEKLLAQSEAAHGAPGSSEPNKGAGPDAAPGAMMPGFGCAQMPMPSPENEIGMLPREQPIGKLLGALFGAVDTDYFYED